MVEIQDKIHLRFPYVPLIKGVKLRYKLPSLFQVQKQLFSAVLRKRCPENIPQIYSSTLMPNCDSNM